MRKYKIFDKGQIFYSSLFFIALAFAGCGPAKPKVIKICPGTETLAKSLNSLKERVRLNKAFNARGKCILEYYHQGRKKENFPVKLWINPPHQIRLQGEVAFNKRGIDVGSNNEEFWLGLKPKEIGNSYYWGKWPEQTGFGKLRIDPKTVLEALGIVEIGKDENWSLANQGAYDILAMRDENGTLRKNIHIYNCDYRVAKIEYFDPNEQVVVVTQLQYNKSFEDISVPDVIRIETIGEDDDAFSFKIKLKSVNPFEFDDKKQKIFFMRQQSPKGFKHILRIIGDEAFEQTQ